MVHFVYFTALRQPFEDVIGIITFFPCLFKTKRIEKGTSEMNKQRFKYLKFSVLRRFIFCTLKQPFEDVIRIITFFLCLFKTKRICGHLEMNKQRFKYLKFSDGPFFVLHCFETTNLRCHCNNYIFPLLIPVVHLDLRISPQIFNKFEITLVLFSGASGKMIHEKNLKQKIS
jgi:hypothetical protein